MLFLPGVEPPSWVAKFQLPGSFSLPSVPPAKMLSFALGSGAGLIGLTPGDAQSVRECLPAQHALLGQLGGASAVGPEPVHAGAGTEPGQGGGVGTPVGGHRHRDGRDPFDLRYVGHLGQSRLQVRRT